MLRQDAAFQGITVFPGHGADVEGIGRCLVGRLLQLAFRRRVARKRSPFSRQLRHSCPRVRGAGLLQGLHPPLAVHARASLAAGARAEALGAVDELLECFAAEGSQQLSGTLPDFVVAAVELGRADAFRQAITTIKKPTPWIAAARAFAEGDFTAAAATYAQIGSLPDAAYARLRAAKALVQSGRPVEADEPFKRRWLSVGRPARRDTSAKPRSCSTRANWPKSNSTCREVTGSRKSSS
jgi:hypothetical protein